MAATCDNCQKSIDGSRVVFTSEATDESGIDVVVAKRWVVCPECAQSVFDRIDEPSPWSDIDDKTLVMPDEDSIGSQLGGMPPRASLA